MKVNFVSLFAVVLVLGAVCPAAFAENEFRVGFVDVQKALQLSKAGKRAQTQYEGDVKSAQKEIDVKKEEFENRRKSFESQKESLNEKALTEKREELLGLERDLKRSFQDSKEKLGRKNNQIVSDLLVKLREVVGRLGKEQGFTVILEKGSDAVLYADSGIDITDDVVKQFDTEFN